MKNIRSLVIIAAIASVALSFCAGTAAARNSQDDVLIQKLISLGPGEEEQFNFYINGVFDLESMGPMATFVIFTTGDVASLSMELVIDPDEELELEFTDVIEGKLVGVGFSTGGEFGTIFDDSAEISINSTFGMAIVGAIITERDTHYRGSIPCGLFLAATEPEE